MSKGHDKSLTVAIWRKPGALNGLVCDFTDFSVLQNPESQTFLKMRTQMPSLENLSVIGWDSRNEVRKRWKTFFGV